MHGVHYRGVPLCFNVHLFHWPSRLANIDLPTTKVMAVNVQQNLHTNPNIYEHSAGVN